MKLGRDRQCQLSATQLGFRLGREWPLALDRSRSTCPPELSSLTLKISGTHTKFCHHSRKSLIHQRIMPRLQSLD